MTNKMPNIKESIISAAEKKIDSMTLKQLKRIAYSESEDFVWPGLDEEEYNNYSLNELREEMKCGLYEDYSWVEDALKRMNIKVEYESEDE
ncbi:MAG: hypothetical protein AABY22_34815 [Nanoarchaeota archaeon]